LVSTFGEIGSSTAAVYGYSLNTYTGYFTSPLASSSCRVLYAEATASGDYDAIAVYGDAGTADGYGLGGPFYGGFTGVYGTGHGGASSLSAIGIRGTAYHDTGIGTSYGVYGGTSGGSVRYAVYASGDIYCTGAYLRSDKKLKTNIRPSTGGLDKILKLRPKSYSYLPDLSEEMALPAGTQTGFVAQDVEEIFPELVSHAVHLAEDKDDTDGEMEFKALNYTGLIPHLVLAIQNQQEIIDSQNKAIADLASRLEALESVTKGN